MSDSTNIPNQTQLYRTDTTSKAEKITQSQLWNIEVTFNNHTTTPYQMSPEIILEMVIEEDLLDWPYKGYLIYKNIYESIERNLSPDAFTFRMDGKDEINIKIKPISENAINNPYGKDAKNIWNINMDFIIYDVEDLPSSNMASKAKKIYFWDKKYQKILDYNIQWSTATAKSNQNQINPKQAKDSDRIMYTGDAIKDLLSELGYEDNFDNDNWDKGSTQIFYTSPSNAHVSDDLIFLLNRHLSSENNDVCIFNINRFNGKWQLKSLHKFFDEAGFNPNMPGPLQIEHLFFEDPYPQNNNDTTPYKAPINNEASFTNDIKITNWNTIETYQFVDMSGIDSSKAMISKPTYWYNPKCKQFGVDFKDNEITNVKADFKKLYTDKLLPKEKASPLITLNKSKTDQYNIDPQFGMVVAGSYVRNSKLFLGRKEILFSGLFLNECISYRIIGSTHRIAGTFVGIDRQTNIGTNKFDNKICGQWFVVNVKHIWKFNKYINDVTAVKVHAYQDLGIKEDIT